MPRKAAASAATAVTAAVEENGAVEETSQNGTNASLASPPSADTAAPIKVNLGDGAVIKHVLDEHAARVWQPLDTRRAASAIRCHATSLTHAAWCCLSCVQLLCSCGYSEDVSFSNVKLALGVVAVAVCAAANLLSGPFPQSLDFIKYCVLVYFAIHVVLQLMHLLLPPNTILVTHTRPRLPANSHSLDPVQQKQLLARSKHTTPPLVLTSSMARYSTKYELALGVRQGRTVGGGLLVERALPVTDFFDSDGLFLKDKYEARVKGMVDELERRQQDRVAGSKKKSR